MARHAAAAGLLLVCALLALSANAEGSDIAVASATSARHDGTAECKPGQARSSRGRCVPVRNPYADVTVRVFAVMDGVEVNLNDLPEVVYKKGSALRTAAGRTAASSTLGRRSPGATLPPDSTLQRWEFTAPTTAPPERATGVKCVITSDPAVFQKLTVGDPDQFLAEAYSARTSRCYTCTPKRGPKVADVGGVVQYAPVNCLARCNPNDSVGPYTVTLSKSGRWSDRLIGNAWITFDPNADQSFGYLCYYTFPGKVGKDWIAEPNFPTEPPTTLRQKATP